MLDYFIFNIDVLIGIGFALLSGVSLRIAFSLVGQRWVRTYHHTVTFALLPVIALIITKVISGNIALSLGMIGALSIVRFRNPVKSPLELVIFFGLLTIGIAAGVNIKFGILLLVTVLAVVIGMHFLENLAAKWGVSMTALSFDEGVPANLLEITTAEPVEEFRRSGALQQYYHSKSVGAHSYKLAFRHRRDLDAFVSGFESDQRIENLETLYGSPV